MIQKHEINRTRGILPATIIPTNYHISLSDLEYGGSWRYHGSVRISGNVLESTDEIVLNAQDLGIESVVVNPVDNHEEETISCRFHVQPEQSQIQIQTDRPLLPGPIEITVRYTGTINDELCGFYRAKLPSALPASKWAVRDGADSYVLLTHFEPCEARRAFPCFDEPRFKAVFQLEVELPGEQTALSNMPVQTVSPADSRGRRRVLFEPTPRMSSYLLCWAIGDFEYVERATQRKHNGHRVPVRVYTTPGYARYAEFAVQHACDVLDYFAEIFKVDYALPKCDHIAVPEFVSGAMENWGLITYRTTKILFDEKTSSNKVRLKAAYVIAHELAHQWFGNLVTMEWWNELWLNEGFATWAGYLAIDHLLPSWSIWEYFTAEVMQEAFMLDALAASHPVELPVTTTNEAEQMFDDITYLKGASLIRMLINMLGESAFLTGISLYLSRYAYQSATSGNLFTVLEEVSPLKVADLMQPWVRKKGFPVLEISAGENGTLLRQQRLCSCSTAHDQDDAKDPWQLPLADAFPGKWLPTETMNTKAVTVCKADSTNVMLNPSQTAYFVSKYPSEAWEALLGPANKMTSLCTVGLLRDLHLLASHREISPVVVLRGLDRHSDDGNSGYVLSEKAKCVDLLESMMGNNDRGQQALQKFRKMMVTRSHICMDWTNDNSDYAKVERQRVYLDLLVGVGDSATCNHIDNHLPQWIAEEFASLLPSLRPKILGRAVASGDEAIFHQLWDLYFSTTVLDGREVYLAAMAKTPKPALIQQLLDFATLGEMSLQDAEILIGSISGNDVGRQALWRYMKEHWSQVYAYLSRNRVVLGSWIEIGLSEFGDWETLDDITAFFKDKGIVASSNGFKIVLDSIKRNIALKGHGAEDMLSWLQGNGFCS